MRVIVGTCRSRLLKGLALRSTTDRLRETLFKVLAPSRSTRDCPIGLRG
jgi:16S rRNA G966 N2-methylase RsmD